MERKNYTVAVDLGCSSVVVAVGEKTPEGLLDVACLVTKPVEEGVHAGRIENIELVSQAIREAVSEAEASETADDSSEDSEAAAVSEDEVEALDSAVSPPPQEARAVTERAAASSRVKSLFIGKNPFYMS